MKKKKSKKAWYSRARFIGAIMFNTAAMMVPATYFTLSKAWVAHINTTDVAITDSYTYLGVIAKILNEGLPSVGYLIIGDVTISKEKRFNLIHSLVCFQALAGLVMSLIFIFAASSLSSILIPGEVSSKSIRYIQISSCSIFFNVVDCTIVLAFRTADRPDIPIIINITKTLVNIILDIVLISKFRIIDVTTVNIQAISRLICDCSGVIAAVIAYKQATSKYIQNFSLRNLKPFLKPSIYTFSETILRNSIYLWLVSIIVKMERDYATAWGVFNTIRWGIVMVPNLAFFEAASTFTGHRWSLFKKKAKENVRWKDIINVMMYSIQSTILTLIMETMTVILMSVWLIEPFALFLSEDENVVYLVKEMWSSLCWSYLLTLLGMQLSAILIATWPAWFFIRTIGSSVLWTLPWTIALSLRESKDEMDWYFFGYVIGGGLITSFVVTVASVCGWMFIIKNRHFTDPRYT
ncbi:uncharacterized protein LOC136025308 [Artemia franciscana]|uniref:uncharacterized protein LOC136025308 n=1 Tax=Artemia franciscana TaxID=6661 RepID=UPI0032DB07A2